MDWLEALILGVVQGVTEFLPVSSDGHLAVTQIAFARATGRSRTASEDVFFDVMLHVGTLAAIVIFFRAVAWTGARGLLGNLEVPPAYRRPEVIRTGFLAAVATSPLIAYVKAKPYVEHLFHSLTAVGLGFLVTAAALLLTARLKGGEKGPREMTWVDALIIGLAQLFAPLPGVSRSGLTVAAALACGLSRSWAVGFSLLIAVPAILGATVFELKHVDPKILTPERVSQTIAATVVAGLIGYMAIRWLIQIVRSGRLWYFSVYLVILALIVLGLAAFGGGSSDVGRTEALDRPAWRGVARAGAGGDGGRPFGRLDRRVPAGARPVGARPDPAREGDARPARLVLV